MKLYNEQFITTDDFSKYLILKGWVLSNQLPHIANVWRYKKNNDFEIIQPIKADLKDFSNRVNDIVNTLSESENKLSGRLIILVMTLSV